MKPETQQNIASSVDIAGIRRSVLALLRDNKARPKWHWPITTSRLWCALFPWLPPVPRLISYDCYLLWRDDDFSECDTRAQVWGFERPADHCPRRYRIYRGDPDVEACKYVTEQIIELCAPIWKAYDNVRVMAYLSRGIPSFSVDIPGQGAVL